jgi:hypothetical protein
MHGLTLRASRTVLPRWVNSQLSLTPAVCGEEGPIDRAARAEKHVHGHNRTATFDVPRERVLENRGNAQPEYPRRGFPRLQAREDVNAFPPANHSPIILKSELWYSTSVASGYQPQYKLFDGSVSRTISGQESDLLISHVLTAVD